MATHTTPINTRRVMEVIVVDILTEDNKTYVITLAPGQLAIDKMREKGYSYDQFIEVPRGTTKINC